MKKLLAMVLALVMTLSLAVSANALKADEKINEDYAEAVAVLDGMGVFKGYEDGSFKPENKITRAEVATIIYRIYTADVAKNDKSGLYATYNKFSDMAGAGWAAGYIGYCANAEFVKGYPDGTFKPSGNITGYEVLAMILRAVGYDKNGEFTGADWALNVAKYAEQLGVLDNVEKTTNLGAPATRELVAELLFRAIQSPMVTYTPAFGYQTDKALTLAQITLAKKNFYLDSKASEDEWGRPSTKWFNTKTAKTYAVVSDTPVATFQEATAQCDICSKLGEKTSAKIVETYTNGVKSTDAVSYKSTATKAMVGAQGEQLEYYEVKDGYRLVIVDTYLAQVTKVIEEETDKGGHITQDDCIKMTVFAPDGAKFESPVYAAGNDYAKDEYVLVNVNEEKANNVEFVGLKGEQNYVEVVGKADSLVAAQTAIWRNANKHTIDEKDYQDAVMYVLDDAGITKGIKFTWFFDQFGNVIGSANLDRSSYAVLKNIEWVTGKPGHAEATLITFDGELTEKTVTVNTIDGVDVDYDWILSSDDAEPALYDSKNAFFWNDQADVSVDSSNNEKYNGLSLYMVETNDDDSVNLQAFDAEKEDVGDNYTIKESYVNTATNATLNVKTSRISWTVGKNSYEVFVTDDTQFIVRSEDAKGNYVYTAYTGTDKIAEMAEGTIDVMFSTPNAKYDVDYVYILEYTPAELDAHLLYTTVTDYQIVKKDLYKMNVILDGAETAVYTADKAIIEALSDKTNTNKLFAVTIDTNAKSDTYGYITDLELVNYKTQASVNAGTDLAVDYVKQGIADLSGKRILTGYDAYYLDENTKVIKNNEITTLDKLTQKDLDKNGIWVVYETAASKYLRAKYVYVGTALDTEFNAELTYTYLDSSDKNKEVSKTVKFVWNDENNAFDALEIVLDKDDTFKGAALTIDGKNSYIDYANGAWLLRKMDYYSNYAADGFAAKDNAVVTAEVGTVSYTLSWEIKDSGTKDLIASLIDFVNKETVLYTGNGDCYADLATAVANVKKLSYDEAESAQLMLNAGVNPTGVKYRNFTSTADVKAELIDKDILHTGRILFANAENVIAVSITVDSVDYYAVFQVVAK